MRIVPVHASALTHRERDRFVPDNNFYIQCFLMSFIKEMYWFDGYSISITHLVLGAYFPSILLFDFYSVCISTHVHNLDTVRKPALRPI